MPEKYIDIRGNQPPVTVVSSTSTILDATISELGRAFSVLLKTFIKPLNSAVAVNGKLAQRKLMLSPEKPFSLHEQTLVGLAHELRTPIYAIEGAIEMLSSKRRSFNSKIFTRDYLEMIERNTKRLDNYVNELLEAIRFQDNETCLSKKTIDLSLTCSTLFEFFSPWATSKDVCLRLVAPRNMCRVRCDSKKIELILSNLISNAIKFTEAGQVTVSLTPKRNAVIAEISDTGKGILPNELPFVFDRFFQGTAGRVAKGSGIGLTIAKVWVEAHGGEIYAESDGLNRGAKFWFVLPKI